MTDSQKPILSKENRWLMLVLLAILVAIGWIGLRSGLANKVTAWFWTLLLMAAFAVVVGRMITGLWRGILIDNRNKMSLSRLQMLSWTLVILSAIFTALLTNVGYVNSLGADSLSAGGESPLDIEVPAQLWILMGISTVSLVASPTILSSKSRQEATPEELEAMKDDPSTEKVSKGVVARNEKPEQARWGDLLMGEEIGNYRYADLGKMQMFFFTFILVISYGAAIASMFAQEQTELITSLPGIEEGMNVLLGISHTGYLANKTVPHTKTA
jgi:hypothetical protein